MWNIVGLFIGVYIIALMFGEDLDWALGYAVVGTIFIYGLLTLVGYLIPWPLNIIAIPFGIVFVAKGEEPLLQMVLGSGLIAISLGTIWLVSFLSPEILSMIATVLLAYWWIIAIIVLPLVAIMAYITWPLVKAIAL